jgi:hypothetical protein
MHGYEILGENNVFRQDFYYSMFIRMIFSHSAKCCCRNRFLSMPLDNGIQLWSKKILNFSAMDAHSCICPFCFRK